MKTGLEDAAMLVKEYCANFCTVKKWVSFFLSFFLFYTNLMFLLGSAIFVCSKLEMFCSQRFCSLLVDDTSKNDKLIILIHDVCT